MVLNLALAGFAAASLLAGGQVPAESAELPVQKPAFDPNYMVCKKFPPPPGTRIGDRRICKTALEWQMIEDSDQEALERALRKPCDAGRGGGICG